MKAIMRRNVDLAKKMVEYGCPLNERWGSSYPLDMAVSSQNEAMVRLLVAHGAFPRTESVAARIRAMGISVEAHLERADD